eukprot:CAMPEP_0168614602 /NCGR_PEP_ID=MMETSP0449_2-20121227/4063_1 /TAXON_ID=1082188 /ORGANISM="Strombidium rassoulzadegani, Strain ras09" /LENGTH=90 /DNA_ID=CAMNT_0008655295 /DNA_START=346 /DNA_END=618 /DNA_ORIENTATION=+
MNDPEPASTVVTIIVLGVLFFIFLCFCFIFYVYVREEVLPDEGVSEERVEEEVVVHQEIKVENREEHYEQNDNYGAPIDPNNPPPPYPPG